MTWFVDGDSGSLTLGISESGCHRIEGNAINHKIQKSLSSLPSSHEIAQKKLFEKLSSLEFLWSIHPSNAKDLDICDNNIDNSPDLFERCRSSPESNHFYLCYYDFEDDRESPIQGRVKSIAANIILPVATFDKVWALFHSVLLEPSLYYDIRIDFLGFKVEGSSSETLTINEFLNGKPYYSHETLNGVSFGIGRKIKTLNAYENDFEH